MSGLFPVVNKGRRTNGATREDGGLVRVDRVEHEPRAVLSKEARLETLRSIHDQQHLRRTRVRMRRVDTARFHKPKR